MLSVPSPEILTFVFTDAMKAAIERHHPILRDAMEGSRDAGVADLQGVFPCEASRRSGSIGLGAVLAAGFPGVFALPIQAGRYLSRPS